MNINAAGRQAEGLADAASGEADIAQRMGFIHHQQQVMATLGFHGAGQIQNLPVHAIDALTDQQAAAKIAPRLFHDLVQAVPIAIFIGEDFRARQLGAGDDAVMRPRS